MIDVTPDAIPVISGVDALPGFWIATGFSGHGFGIGPGAGRLMADLVTGAAPLVDPAVFRLARYTDGSRARPISGFQARRRPAVILPAMTGNATRPTGADVAAFIAAVTPPAKAADAHALDALFREVTGFQPRMWGRSIVGYGRYHYVYDSGREGDFFATGFSPRKAAHVVYIMPGYADFGAILARLGKHKTGKSCLYVTKLADIDIEVLAELIRAGLDDLARRWPVRPE